MSAFYECFLFDILLFRAYPDSNLKIFFSINLNPYLWSLVVCKEIWIKLFVEVDCNCIT